MNTILEQFCFEPFETCEPVRESSVRIRSVGRCSSARHRCFRLVAATSRCVGFFFQSVSEIIEDFRGDILETSHVKVVDSRLRTFIL